MAGYGKITRKSLEAGKPGRFLAIGWHFYDNRGVLSSLPGSPIYGEFDILDTDYDSYAVAYSCYQFLFFKYELGWILTREAIASQFMVRYNKVYLLIRFLLLFPVYSS